MCGIVGYIGNKNAEKILIEGLEKLEYRGYDSAGIAVYDGNALNVCKEKGKLANLKGKLEEHHLEGKLGIGHTRWATHGEPSHTNSHPHLSENGEFAVVHNGIIENYREIKEFLKNNGFVFSSQTDTEVIPQLLQYNYDGDIIEAVQKTVKTLKGSYALGIISKNDPDILIAVRKDSPLIIGKGADGNYIASDIPAVLPYTDEVYLLEDGETAILKKDDVKIFDGSGKPVKRDIYKVTFSAGDAQKNGYEHFMLKEIHEQPEAVANTLRGRLDESLNLDFDGFDKEILNKVEKIYIVACGTAYHAGLAGKIAIEKLARVSVECVLASEFRYQDPIVNEKTLVITVSQSGETADTMAALRLAKERRAYVVAITNVVGSSISREADFVFYTYAGPEIAVASTKAYITQLTALYLFALFMAETAGKSVDTLKKELFESPARIRECLLLEEKIKELSKNIYKESDMYYLGRGEDLAAAMEGCLKLKEISYIHSEAYAGGELKHGPIALIEQGTVVVTISTNDALKEKMYSNIKEVVTRGAYTVTFVNEETADINKSCDCVVKLPGKSSVFSPMYSCAALQMLAYFVAKEKGYDIDKPRNLAKSVTVE